MSRACVLAVLLGLLGRNGLKRVDPPLIEAVYCRRSEEARRLLAQGVDPNVTGYRGTTALHEAAANGDVAMVKLLLSAGANIHALDEGDVTGSPRARAPQKALGRAIIAGKAGTARLLVEAHPMLAAPGSDLPAVHFEVRECKPNVLRALLEAGCPPETKDSQGRTALDLAKYWQCDSCTRVLQR